MATTYGRPRRRALPTRLVVVALIFVGGYLAALSGVPGGSSSPKDDDHFASRRLLETTDNTTKKSEYPNDVFTAEQIGNGAVVLYIIGVMYMFIALAIVCDEFFVPALEVITETLKISEDVAGATFMAAGGSAPELFTSFIGVFIAHSDVGIGTIVGSAVFNILFVIGMCAIVSTQVLALTWWPLFRDVSFYSISLVCLMCFFLDNKIYWWEALILFVCYILYVLFMKFNHAIEAFVKSKIYTGGNRINSAQARSSDNLIGNGQPAIAAAETTPSAPRHTSSITCNMPTMKAGSGKFRHGVLQLMIHTIDPMSESVIQDKAVKLHAIASIKVIVNADNHNSPGIIDNNSHVKNGSIPAISNGVVTQEDEGEDVQQKHHRMPSQQTTITTVGSITDYTNSDQKDETVNVISHTVTLGNGSATDAAQATSSMPSVSNSALPSGNNGVDVAAAVPGSPSPSPPAENGAALEPETGPGNGDAMADIDSSSTPLDLSWPNTARKRIIYVLVAPLVFLLWLTLPDVRRRDRRRFYALSFIGSIIWIALFAYLMNWWAAVIGVTAGIKTQVMGLTFLAGGTSIPDLITSVIVAKKGYGDMAVSSSVGSNIFDVTVGLPIPWLIYGLLYNEPYLVDSEGLFCSIVLLFIMLILLIVMIAAFKWRMNRTMGISCLVLYFVFLTLALLLEYGVIECFLNA